MQFNTVALPSSDIEITKSFLQKIGFKPLRAIEVVGKQKKWSLLYLGANSEICYYPADSAEEIFSNLNPPSTRSSGMICLNCDTQEEVDGLSSLLSKLGYLESKPLPTDWGRYALYFRDPDGHCFEYSAAIATS